MLQFKNNFPREEDIALKSLQKNNEITLKTLSKYCSWFKMDIDFYRYKIGKGHFLSNVYKDVPTDSDKEFFKNLKRLIVKYTS